MNTKTCIFVGDANQTFLNQRRGQSPEQFPLVSGRAHGAASKNRKVSKLDDVKNEVELVDEEELRVNNLMLRGTSDWFDKGNGNIEHLSGLTQCKRCGPAITKFLSFLLAPDHSFPVRVQQHGASNNAASHNAGSGWWTWDELRDYARTAASGAPQGDASKLWKVSYNAASSIPKQHVVWHEVLFRALLVQVEWDLYEMQKGERMLIICFLRCVSEPVAALLAAFLSEEDAKRVDVVLLDSARGPLTECTSFTAPGSWAGTISCWGFKQTPADCMWHTLEDDRQLLSEWSGTSCGP